MRDILLHAHIFKNAGSTLDWSLARSFGDGFRAHRADKLMRPRPAEELARAADDPGLRALSSHTLPFPLQSIDGIRFSTLVLLRHPLHRARSVYRFERRQDAATPGARAAKALDFADYVRWRLRDDVGPTIRNFQTRYLAGQRARQPGFVTTPATFRSALDCLAEQSMVGVVERYPESMLAFETVLAARFPELDLAFLPQNMTRESLGDERLDWLAGLGSLGQALIDHNSYDLALYQLARAALDDRLARLGVGDEATARFRERQRLLSHELNEQA